MSKIPSEHEAARSLEESFRRLGAQRADNGRTRRSNPVGRLLVVGVTFLLAATAVAAGTKVFVADGGSVGPEHTLRPDIRRSPADRRLSQARASDPSGGAPWGTRLYTNSQGNSCVVAGRVVRSQLGVLQSGRFTELPSSAPGVCNDLARGHVLVTIRNYGDPAVPGGRTVLYGIADRTIRSLEVVTSAGMRVPVPIAPDGTYMVVLARPSRLRLAHLDVVGEHGRSVRALGG